MDARMDALGVSQFERIEAAAQQDPGPLARISAGPNSFLQELVHPQQGGCRRGPTKIDAATVAASTERVSSEGVSALPSNPRRMAAVNTRNQNKRSRRKGGDARFYASNSPIASAIWPHDGEGAGFGGRQPRDGRTTGGIDS